MKNNKSQKQKRDWNYEKRKKAIELYNKGWKQSQIAEALDVSQSCVSLWVKRFSNSGLEALKSRYSPGAPSKLSLEQKQQLLEMLKQEPNNFGFPGHSWIRKQVAELIRQRFNVTYDLTQISRILKSINVSRKSSTNIKTLFTILLATYYVMKYA